MYLLEKYQSLIIQGETGSGKSTQIGQFLAESGWCDGPDGILRVCITQPRRVAAITLAVRVAEEKGCQIAEEVGYTIRFDDKTSAKTQIKYVTEGVLIREMMSDPLLKTYSVIMIDEAHERTLNTDILLVLLKDILRKRPELRLIVSSATLEADIMRKYLNFNKTSDRNKDKAVILSVEGRSYPVEVYYSNEPVPNYVSACVEAVIQIHESEASGDVLVFLTGQEEVEEVVNTLKDYSRTLKERPDLKKMFVLPMYGSLPAKDQYKVFETFPRSVRKVVVSTNVAEASVTIPGIYFVVDSGFVKMRFYSPKTCSDTLIIVPTSQASAQQRAGRAGRLRSGKVYRLYPESEFVKLTQFTPPEIERSTLAFTILQLKALGIKNVVELDFPTPPPQHNLITGLELLFALGAIDDRGELVQPLGEQMAEFPLHPMFSKMLLSADKFECAEEALTITAMLQVENLFTQPASGQRSIQARNAKHNLSVEEGDWITYLNIYNKFLQEGKIRSWADRNYLNYKGLLKGCEIREKLISLMNRFKVKIKSANGDVDKVRRCIVSGFFANAAYLHSSGTYRTVRGDHELHIHPSSVLFTQSRPPKWVIFSEILHTSQEFMRDLTVVQPKWLYDIAPHYYKFGTERELREDR